MSGSERSAVRATDVAKPPLRQPVKAARRHLGHFDHHEIRRTIDLIVVDLHPKDWVDIKAIWYPVKGIRG